MPLFSGYTVDEYTRLLTVSRWVFAVLAICAVAAGIFSQWISTQMVAAQVAEQTKMREHLLASQAELRRLSHNTTEVADALGRLTDPRRITASQSAALQKSLASGPRGKVVLTYLSVEWDAEEYARQIADLLIAFGFEVRISEHLWVEMAHDGLFFCSPGSEELPPRSAAAYLHECFAAAGVKLTPTVNSAEICQAVEASEGEAVMVVSNRN
jgi:hypothetical protein